MEYFFTFITCIVVLFTICKIWNFRCKSKMCLVGKTALITGGAEGIGYNAALILASRGCRVIIADVIDTTKPVKDIIEATHNPQVLGKKLDLTSLQSVRDLAKDIYESEPRVDILLNNAGTGNVNLSYSEDGLERTMQTNYFGHFLLTHLLIDLLKKSAPTRIVFTNSAVCYFSNLSIAKLNPKAEDETIFDVFLGGTYGASKLAMAAASKLFGEKLKGTGVTSNTVHPGAVRTNIYFKKFSNNWRDVWRAIFGICVWLFAKTVEDGAQTLIQLAIADETKNTTAKYFSDGMSVYEPFPIKNRKYCQEIWDRSIIFTKLEPHELKC